MEYVRKVCRMILWIPRDEMALKPAKLEIRHIEVMRAQNVT